MRLFITAGTLVEAAEGSSFRRTTALPSSPLRKRVQSVDDVGIALALQPALSRSLSLPFLSLTPSPRRRRRPPFVDFTPSSPSMLASATLLALAGAASVSAIVVPNGEIARLKRDYIRTLSERSKLAKRQSVTSGGASPCPLPPVDSSLSLGRGCLIVTEAAC